MATVSAHSLDRRHGPLCGIRKLASPAVSEAVEWCNIHTIHSMSVSELQFEVGASTGLDSFAQPPSSSGQVDKKKGHRAKNAMAPPLGEPIWAFCILPQA